MRKLADIMANQALLDADDRDLYSRTDARYERLSQEETLVQLGKALTELSARKLLQLELPEAVLDAVHDAQAISSPAARNRQVKVVRSRLRDSDWAAIKTRLDTLLLHGAPKKAAPSLSTIEGAPIDWTSRLVAEGAEALEAFLAEHPAGDRSQLRQLIRNVHKAGAPLQAKATEKLRQVVVAAMQT